MRITLQLLGGSIVIEAEKKEFCSKLLNEKVMQETTAVTSQQIKIRCECEGQCEFRQDIMNAWNRHSYCDGQTFCVFVEPLYSLQYVNNFDVSQFYRKNDTAISSHPDKVIWVNSTGGNMYEVTKWDSSKNSCSSVFRRMTNVQLRELCQSEEVSPIAKIKIEWLL